VEWKFPLGDMGRAKMVFAVKKMEVCWGKE
jgi:hypothetical protein